MNDIILQEKQLPDNITDLSKFALVGREKLAAVKAEINAIKKIGLANDVLEQKRREAQEIAELVTLSEVRVGEMLREIPKASGGDRKSDNFKNVNNVDFEPQTIEPKQPTKTEVIKSAGIAPKTAERFQQMAAHKDIVVKVIQEAREKNDIVSRSTVLNKIKLEEKKETIKQAERKIVEQADNSIKPVIYIGDSTKHEPKEKYDLLLTDPPYSTDVDNIEEFVNSWLYNALSNVKSTGFAYIFIGAYPNEVRAYLNAKIPEHIELCQQLIWTYKNTLGNNPKDRYKQNYQVCLFYRGVDAPELDCPLTNEQWAVQEINAPDGRQGDRYHAWQKPIEIAERFIRHSTKKDMTIYDPFACTGTFLLAAAKLGRKAYGYEINEDNAKIAIERGCFLAEA